VYVGEWLHPRYGFVMDDEPDTQELRAEQLKRAMQEDRLAEVSGEEEEIAQHKRRADKARYLRGKLEQREASEHEVMQREASERELKD
jgi:hypothetical protein